MTLPVQKTEFLAVQRLLKTARQLFFLPQVGPEELEVMGGPVLTEETEVIAEILLIQMAQKEETQQQTFLMMCLSENLLPVVVAELDIAMAKMPQAERLMVVVAELVTTNRERMEDCPAAAVELVEMVRRVELVQKAAFTCAFIGRNLS